MKIYILNTGQSLAARVTSETDPRITVSRTPEAAAIAEAAAATDKPPAAAYGYALETLRLNPIITELHILDSAVGGQEIDRYVLTDDDHFQWDGLVGLWTAAGSPEIAAEIFIQSEADWREPTSTHWLEKRRTVRSQIEAMLRNAGRPTGFPTISSVPYCGNGATVRAVRSDALRKMPHVLDNHHVLETANLTDAPDGIHFEAPTLVGIGRNMAHMDNTRLFKEAMPPVNECVQIVDGDDVFVEMYVPRTYVVDSRGAGKMRLPAAGASSGTVMHVYVDGSLELEEVKDRSDSGYGFMSLDNSPTDTLPRGVYTIAAMPNRRRWLVTTISN